MRIEGSSSSTGGGRGRGATHTAGLHARGGSPSPPEGDDTNSSRSSLLPSSIASSSSRPPSRGPGTAAGAGGLLRLMGRLQSSGGVALVTLCGGVALLLVVAATGSFHRGAAAGGGWLGPWDKVALLGGGGQVAAIKGAAPSAPPRRDVRCGGGAQAGGRLRPRGWDTLHVLSSSSPSSSSSSISSSEPPSSLAAKSSVLRVGNLERLQEALSRAEAEERPLRIGVLGGSFSAGGAVADYEDSYSEVLRRRLEASPGLVKHGVEMTNMAQGGAGFMLPLFCTDKVYSMVANDSAVSPDVWIVEFAENFDSSLEWYEALLAMLLFDKERFGKPAVLTAAVAKNFCWFPSQEYRTKQCGLYRTLPWLQEAAAAMDLPLVSFLHGVGPALGLDPQRLMGSTNETGGAGGDIPGSSKEAAVLEHLRVTLYADCGENQHFNEYGHRLMGEFLLHLFQQAASFSTPFHGRRPAELDEASKGSMLPAALDVYSRLSSGSSGRTLTCNLTLTQGRAIDLVPSHTSNFSLWAERVKDGNKLFSSRTRADRKKTWTPKAENATIDFDFTVPAHATTLCVLMYGANGMMLEASFPGHEKEEVTMDLTDDEEFSEDDDDDQEHAPSLITTKVVATPAAAGGNATTTATSAAAGTPSNDSSSTAGSSSSRSSRKCVQVQADGSRVDCSTPVAGAVGPEEQGRVYVHEVSTTCSYKGGVDWTPFSVYKIDCGCRLPVAMADGTPHTIRFRSTIGLVQIAGVVIW